MNIEKHLVFINPSLAYVNNINDKSTTQHIRIITIRIWHHILNTVICKMKYVLKITNIIHVPTLLFVVVVVEWHSYPLFIRLI